MDISVSHAPSTFVLEIHAVLMFVRVVEVDVSSILKICVRAVCPYTVLARMLPNITSHVHCLSCVLANSSIVM